MSPVDMKFTNTHTHTHTHTQTHRFAELLHQDAELAAELAADADERQLADLLDGRVAVEYLLDERVFALGHQSS